MFLDRVLINCEAQTGCVGDGDVSILDDRLGHTVNEIAPEWDFDEVMLKGNEILCRRGALDTRHCADGCARHMQSHADSVLLCKVTDLLCFQNAAARGEVRMNDVDCV